MSDPDTDKDKARPRASERIWEVITSSTFVGLLVFLGSLFGIGVLLWLVVSRLGESMSLPLLALASVLLLLGALLVFTTLIHLIGLSDPKSALGLPEGSVRAILALALLGLFAIMASSVLTNTHTNPQTQVDEFGKQMLTLVGTLMTAVISFYFGSATTQASAGAAAATPPAGSATPSPPPPAG
jgi:hypothetical protein